MNYSGRSLYPTASRDRIVSIDILRGVAVLGILIMNIQSFSMISAAYINPTAYGNLTGINKWVWILSHLMASNKFMSIFSLLFGAGVVIFTNRAIEKGRNATKLFYRRTFWLLIFGLLHAYMIWYGDILTSYALCGFLVFLFRKMKPKKLIIFASIFFVIPVGLNLLAGTSVPGWPEPQYTEAADGWLPPAIEVQKQVESYQSNWVGQMTARVKMAVFMQTFLFLWGSFWQVMAMMLLGMALYKTGILTAQRSNNFYWRMSLIGLIIGFMVSGFGVYQNFKADWFYNYSMFFGSQYNYIGSLATALGYIGLVMIFCKSSGFNYVKKILSSVGKMALTNYILMSLLAMFIFYGNGLGFFGLVARWEQLLIVIGIWFVILAISPVFLKNFYYGPLEWIWRVLTYWQIQEFKKS